MADVYAEDLISRKVVHEVHTSERRSFRGCRRRWYWIHVENYYPTVTPKPLEFGVAYHAGLEALFNPTTWKFPVNVLAALAEKTFVDTCKAQCKAYLKNRPEHVLEDEAQADYDERVELGRGMIKYFVETKLPELREKYVPTHVEVSFDVPLFHGGKHLLCKCKPCRLAFAKAGGGRWKGNPVVFSGRVDMVVHDMRGDYWIWDHKTASQFREIETYLELDDQIASYVFALRRAMGLNIRGFMYFEYRKDYPRPPKENKVVRLGRRFSVNVNQSTDYETYKFWVEKYDNSAYVAGLYDEHLELLKSVGLSYFRMHTVYKSDYELEQVEQNLVAEAMDMTDPNLRIYPMPGTFTCSGCAFQVPCISKNSGQDYEYTLQTLYEQKEPYYRRTRPASTESKGRE